MLRPATGRSTARPEYRARPQHNRGYRTHPRRAEYSPPRDAPPPARRPPRHAPAATRPPLRGSIRRPSGAATAAPPGLRPPPLRGTVRRPSGATGKTVGAPSTGSDARDTAPERFFLPHLTAIRPFVYFHFTAPVL